MIVLYYILRIMVRVTLRIFYKEYSVNGRDRLPDHGPLIMVANHPNTLMDPLVVASLMKQQVGFMGNGSLFRNKPLAKLLRFFNVIPVYRKQDIRPGEQMDNEDYFAEAREFLGKGGTILIFPEGTSYAEKKLRELRTGASRIALSFEQSRNFKGGLIVMPAALNYSESTRFRTRLRIDVGTPIAVGAFADLHAQDPVAAVRALTEAQREQMAERMVILDDKDQERMHDQLRRLQSEQLPTAEGLSALHAEMDLADAIRRVHTDAPAEAERLQTHLDRWFGMMDRLRIREGFFRARFRKLPLGVIWLLQGLLLVALAPLHVFGLVGSWVPYWFPGWIAPRISDEVEYHAPIMMVIGMFLFPIWYALVVLAAWLLGLSGWWLLGLAVALPVTGAVAHAYAGQMDRFGGLTSLLAIRSRKRSLLDRLAEERKALLEDVNAVLGE